MIVKTVLAFLVTASLAGGVVYYGTQSIENTSQETSGQDAETDENISAIQNQLREGLNETEPAASGEEVDAEMDAEMDAELDAEMDAEMDAETDAEIDVEEPIFDTSTETISGAENVSDDDNQQLDRFKFAVEQVERLTNTQLKDQMYLNIIVYALNREMYGEVDLMLGKIDQVEMRDRARGEIAGTLAKRGYVDEALEFIDTAETEKSRDEIRARIIEAILGDGQ